MIPSPSAKLVYSWVQKMNNSAALCLEIGQYDRAITSLAKSLQMSRSYVERSTRSKNNNNNGNTDGTDEPEEGSSSCCCSCHLCTLDGMIHYSEERHRHCHIHRTLRTMELYNGSTSRGTTTGITDNLREESIRQRILQRREERRNANKKGDIDDDTAPSSSLTGSISKQRPKKNGDFFYRRLIQVPCLSLHECYDSDNEDIGTRQIVALSLVSIFNLAVVCHLKAMEQQYEAAAHSTTNKELQKALGLYEVAYKALQNQCNSANCDLPLAEASENTRKSVQFRLVLCNNLSHAHNLAGHRAQHERYLREVLSTTMSLVDSHRLWNNSNRNSNRYSNDDNHRRHSTGNILLGGTMKEGCCIDLEGFLANAAPLMTEANCADAA